MQELQIVPLVCPINKLTVADFAWLQAVSRPRKQISIPCKLSQSPRADTMQTFIHHVTLATPLFMLVLIGYALIRRGRWPKEVSDALSRFVFAIAIPALLFHMMRGRVYPSAFAYAKKCENEISTFGAKIYCSGRGATTFTPSDYYNAWVLRRNCPLTWLSRGESLSWQIVSPTIRFSVGTLQNPNS
jgi:hypothetical protein